MLSKASRVGPNGHTCSHVTQYLVSNGRFKSVEHRVVANHVGRKNIGDKLLYESFFILQGSLAEHKRRAEIHFGESSMQKCEIMLNDLIDSKRTNGNIKATITQTSQAAFSSPTVLSPKMSPFNVPGPVDQLLSDYAKRFNEMKTPRKLLWKKSLGTVKLELQFYDRAVQFVVAPVHAAIIMQFQIRQNLAAAIGVPTDILNRRINFWISKLWNSRGKLICLPLFSIEGILAESFGADSEDHVFPLMEGMVDSGKKGGTNGSIEDLIVADEEGESSVASVEDQLRKEMTVYEDVYGLKF
ncbi:anaphase-promoting complex/cyclosome 2 [Prunus dulcis]|uniref:Anaphase-promoting complex/cyclosome 2 n=1 Tax=Prunus dulcis TaxID=3755 RepID=A0A5H2XW27_PRUDU|nr:anaphase-promoting complex/cyclosome 2 [Prunus dulcis]